MKNKILLVGSIARGEKNSKDIDLVTNINLDIITNILKKFGAKVLKNGSKYSKYLLDGINYDFWKADNNQEFDSLKVMRTIEKGHNIGYRKIAKENGFLLNDRGLFKQNKRIHFKTEKELRGLIGLKTGSGKPVDIDLYNKIKNEIYKKYPKHSLFRSALIVKKYEEEGGKFKGKPAKMNINKWFNQEWLSANDYLRGEIVPCGSSNTLEKYKEYPLCRPKKILEKLKKPELEKMIKTKNDLKQNHLISKKVLGTNKFNIKATNTGL